MAPIIHLPSTPVTHPLARRWLGHRAYWLCQFAGWGGMWMIFFLPVPFYAGKLGPSVVLAEVVYFSLQSVVGMTLSHAMRVIFLHALRLRRTWWALALRLTAWVVAFAFAQVGVMWSAISLLEIPGDLRPIAGVPLDVFADYVDSLSLYIAIFTIWTGFYLGLRYYRQHQAGVIEQLKLAAAVKEAQLDNLKAQLNPHFLFNSLNTVRALIPREEARPREAITLLSELLRASLNQGANETVTLAREMEAVDNYLALEHMRFEERLQVHRSIERGALEWRVPPFLVQTLVENALKYGLARREEGGEITIEAFVRDDVLQVRVTNPGTLRPEEGSTGVGLKNSRARLELLFGASARLELVQAAADLVQARLSIPSKTVAVSNP